MNVPVKHLPKGIDACHLSPIEMIFQACQQGHRAKPIAKIVFLLPYFFPIWVSQAFFVEGFQGSSESYVCHEWPGNDGRISDKGARNAKQ